MKKVKQIIAVLLGTCLLATMCAFSACDTSTNQTPNTNNENNACNHDYGAWKTVEEAGCLVGGEQIRVCSKCSHAETKTTDALGHTTSSGTCSRCEQNIGNQSTNTQSPEPTDATDGLIFTLIADGTAYEVSGYTGNQSDITIPSTYNFKPVTRIGDSAFSGNTKIKSITLPNSITEIGEFAFFHCYDLTSIVIPNQVKHIEAGTFDGCFKLTSITLSNGIISIGKDAFSDCFGFSSLTIPGSVTLIDASAFSGCNKLTQLTFNGTVQEWETMERKTGWNWIVPATKVTCLDGTVPLK